MAEIVTETERLRLRNWDDADETRFYDIMNTPAVMRWLGGQQTREEWNAGYQRLRGYERDLGFTFWLIERRADDAVLGFCGLKRANAPGGDTIAGQIEIGWRLREDAWGQGHAKEAAIASLDLAFGRFAAPRVVAITVLHNESSQGLMNRLGMTRCNELDYADTRFGPEMNPSIVYVMQAREWPAARAAALT